MPKIKDGHGELALLYYTHPGTQLVNAQLIPRRSPGFTLGNGSADAGVQLESYIDLLCPDSKSAYPGMKKLVQHYETDEVRVRFVPFPLPYHQYAFATAEAAYTIATALGDKSFTDWLEAIYANQDMYDSLRSNMSQLLRWLQ